MKKLLRKPTAYLSAVVVGLSSMLVFAVPSVHAASVLWDGEGGDNNFSTAANWSGDIVPSDGDDLVFRNDTISQSEIYTNDLTNFAPRSFSFQKGVATNYYSITIAGNDITITDGIYTEIPAVLDLNLTLNGDQTFTNAANTTQGSLTIGNQNATRDMNIGISNLTIHDDSSCAVVRIDSNVTGSGQINVTGSYNATVLSKSNSSYTGSINVGAGSYLEAQNAQSLGTTGTGTTVASGGSIGFASASGYTDNSYAEPLNISGTGGQYTGAIVATIPIIGTGCKGGVPDVNFTITLTGTITLQTDITASTWLDNVKLKITGQIVGSHNITVESGSDLILEIASSNNGSSTPNGTVEATPETITVASNDSQPSTPVGIGKNQTVVVNGERGDITVSNKGTLKGSGTVGGVTVETGGTVAPGESPGCLNVGDTTFTSGSNFDVELGGTNVCTEYDQMVVTGTIDLGGATLNTSFVNGFTASSGQSFVIISNDGTEAVTGTFAGLAQGATVTVNGVNFTISYNGGDGNDVVLTFLSAPGTPDSGFEIIRLNPILTLITTTSLAGAIMIIHRKYGEINNK